MQKVRITVKRIAQYDDLIAEYENHIEHACMMKLNQEFFSINAQKPKGFCNSAWESIYPFLKELANGGDNFYDGWMKVVHISRKWSIVSFLA